LNKKFVYQVGNNKKVKKKNRNKISCEYDVSQIYRVAQNNVYTL